MIFYFGLLLQSLMTIEATIQTAQTTTANTGLLAAPLATSVETKQNPQQNCYPVYQPTGQYYCAPLVQQTGGGSTNIITTTTGKFKTSPQSRLDTDLIKIIKSIPDASEKLSSFLEYRGITQPWAEVFDFNTDKQHSMPAPQPMFNKIQLLIGGLESIKEFISNELFKVEKYVRRAKAYLAENADDLKRYHRLLKNYLTKTKSAKTFEAKNEYAKKFSAAQAKTQEKIKSYLELKEWLQTTLKLFRTLF